MPRVISLPLAIACIAGISLAALPVSAQQMHGARTHAINPSQSLSSPATSPVQQQIQQDYHSDLLGAQRDLSQSNPSGLGREQIAIGHMLNGYNARLH